MAATRRVHALLMTDVQGDFLPGGSLAVPRGDEVVVPLCRAADHRGVALRVASLDWHPPRHASFADRGGVWPEHCVAGTPGAALHPEVARRATLTVTKGSAPDRDAYSVFDGTTLAPALAAAGVTDLYVGGLATDYCVRQSVLDALAAGFQVTVLADAVGAVDVVPGDGDRALADMQSAGAEVVSSSALVPEGGGDASS